jgi:hypothetical protein
VGGGGGTLVLLQLEEGRRAKSQRGRRVLVELAAACDDTVVQDAQARPSGRGCHDGVKMAQDQARLGTKA